MTILFSVLILLGVILKTVEAWQSGPTLNAFAWTAFTVAAIIWAIGRF